MTTAASSERHRHALPHGYALGRYEIQDQLGYGSFGITYLARDTMLSRLVAIKELLPTMIASRLGTEQVEANGPADRTQWEWAQQRFIEESRALAACEHPNVLQVYETFQANGTAYMVTRYEEGCNLKDWLVRLSRPPTQPELEAILLPLLDALKLVHSHRFFHRDIKPENIYMARDNRPILIDFGSARQDVTSRSVPVTSIVTEGYAPFEQYSAQGAQGPWTDLYALGAVMYNAITRQVPPFATTRRAAQVDPCQPLARVFAGRYSDRFLQSVDAAMRMNERSRPQSAEEWVRILKGAAPIPPAAEHTQSNSDPQYGNQGPQYTYPPIRQVTNPNQILYWLLSVAIILLAALVGLIALKFSHDGSLTVSPRSDKAPQAQTPELERKANDTADGALKDAQEKLAKSQAETERLKGEAAAERRRTEQQQLALLEEKQKQVEQDRIALLAEQQKQQAERDRFAREAEQDRITREAAEKQRQAAAELERQRQAAANAPRQQIQSFILTHLQHANAIASGSGDISSLKGDYMSLVKPYFDQRKVVSSEFIAQEELKYLHKERGSEEMVGDTFHADPVDGNKWVATFRSNADRPGSGRRLMGISNTYYLETDGNSWHISGQTKN